MIERLQPDKKCPLGLAAEPLQWITNQLKKKVVAIEDKASLISYESCGMSVSFKNNQPIRTEKVVLAIGAEPQKLQFPKKDVISLKVAVNPGLLAQHVNANDVVAIFGSYQSARTVTENILKTKAKKIIHFYRSERSFKAHVASVGLPDTADAHPITPENLLRYMPQCTKVIYAVGFERRALQIAGLPEDYGYDANTGQIAPGIYGLGIAFPEVIPHTQGRALYKVNAIHPMMKHLLKNFPEWLNEPTPRLGLGDEAIFKDRPHIDDDARGFVHDLMREVDV